MTEAARMRLHGFRGGRHLIFGLSHYPFLALAVVVVVVALVVYANRTGR